MNLEQKAQDYLLAHQGDSPVSVMVGFATGENMEVKQIIEKVRALPEGEFLHEYGSARSLTDGIAVADLHSLVDRLEKCEAMLAAATIIEIDYVNERSLRKDRRDKWRGYELANAIGHRVAKTEPFSSATEAYEALQEKQK